MHCDHGCPRSSPAAPRETRHLTARGSPARHYATSPAQRPPRTAGFDAPCPNIEFIWTLEELVGLGTHGAFRNENKILGAQSFLRSNHQRPSAPLVVRCHGKDTQNAVNLLLREIVLQKEVLRVRPHDVLRTGAHSQPFNFHPYQMPYAVLC